jgi:O-antigen ligase
LTFRLPLNFTLSDWLFFAALVFAAVVLLVLHRRVTVEVPIVVLVGGVLFGVGGLVSSLDAALPVQSVAVGARVVYIVSLWFWLGTVLLRDLAQVDVAVRLWTISAGITGAGAVAQLVWGDVIPGATPSWGRMTGFTPHMTDLGGTTCLALVPALWVATRTRTWGMQRLVALATVAFIGAGLILSGSIGSMLAAAVAVFVWLALGAGQLRAIVIAVALAGIIAIPSLAVLEQLGGISPATRLQQVVVSEGEEGSLWSRLQAYQAAWDVIGRNPYVGAGLDDQSSRVDVLGLELLSDGNVIFNRHQVHNVFLGAWYGAGLLGLIGVIAILIGTVQAGFLSVVRAVSDDERLLAAALLASFAGFVVFAQGTVVLYQRYGWIGSALILAIWAQQVRRLRSSERISAEARASNLRATVSHSASG